MAVVNPIDASTTVSAATAGMTVDLRRHDTVRLSLLGVPVRFKVRAEGVAGDTGAIKLLDPNGAVILTVLVTAGKRWYWANGYLPAARQKYDLQLAGNTLGSLKLYSAHVYEYDWTADGVAGALSSQIGPVTLDAHIDPNNILNVTLGAVTSSATGTVEVQGSATPTLGAVTASATGTVASSPPSYQAVGSVAAGSTDQSPAWPAHAVGDIAILLVAQRIIGDPTPPAVPTLSPAADFARGALPTATRSDTHSVRVTAWYCRATSTSMSAPTVPIGSASDQACVIITFRSCIATGDPTDVSSTASGTGTAVSIGSATTTGVSRLVCAFVGTSSGTLNVSSWTNATLTSFTERFDSGASCTISAATGTLASAGSYGTATGTLSSSTLWAGFQFALKPA